MDSFGHCHSASAFTNNRFPYWKINVQRNVLLCNPLHPSLSIYPLCSKHVRPPFTTTCSYSTLPPCIVVLSCLYKWPVRWWMLLSFLHSAALLAGGESMWKPQRPSCSLYPCHSTHTQWPQREDPNDTSFIIQSFCVKTLKEAERLCTFFTLMYMKTGPSLMYMEERVRDMSRARSCRLCSEFEMVQHWLSYVFGRKIVLPAKQNSPHMSCYMICEYWGWIVSLFSSFS